jgi:fructokinase
MTSNIRANRIAIIGEVLFDHFPDGRQILGGAPFNVAWNLKGMGVDSKFLSSVGRDSFGEKILDQMDACGLDKSGVSIHESLPTGSVSVKSGIDGEPFYSIDEDVAYDHLSIEHSTKALPHAPIELACHGSLCFRTESNRRYLSSIIETMKVDRFVDLNIRQPWIDRSWLPLIVDDCRWLKLSSGELAWLGGKAVDETDQNSIRSAVDAVTHNIIDSPPKTYLITCGENGAYWIEEDHVFFCEASPISNFVDSVGAGDAFTAAAIRGLLEGNSPELILKDAVQFAARACTIRGATTDDLSHYQSETNETSKPK